MDLSSADRALLVVGVVLAAVGLLLAVAGAAGIGRLPGDVAFRWGSLHVYVPIVTCLLLSVLATIVLNLLFRRR
jgi:hypothetical protein